MDAPLQMVEPVGSGLGGGGGRRGGSRSGSKTSLERTGRTPERMSNEPDDPDEDNQWLPDHDPRDERGEFASRAQFLLTVIGFTMGNGVFYQFPMAMRKYGGATFLIIYFLCMIIYGVPMLYLEMMIGQIAQVGPMRAFQLNFPLLQGVGWAVCFLSFLRACNFSLLNAYSLEYAVESLVGVGQRTMPALFNNTCISMEQRVKNIPPDEMAAREYFRYTLRGLPASFDDGRRNGNESEFKFESGRVVVCFCIVWIFACICLLRRMRWLGKLSLFIVSGSGLLIFIFTIQCLTMERSDIGLQKFFRINETAFGDTRVWMYAFRMSRLSLSLGMGGMISMASYNKRSNDAFWDSMVVCSVIAAVTLISTMNIFVVIAYCRHLFPFMDWKNREKYLTGYMLYYIYFPEMMGKFKFDAFFSFLFYATLVGLGISTFFGLLETPISALTEQFKFCRKHRSITIIILSIVGFGVGLVQCTRIGYHIFYMFDIRVLPHFAEIMVGFQVITVACYGVANFYRDISASIGKKVNVFGYFLSPYGLLVRISQFIFSPVLMAYVYYKSHEELANFNDKEKGVCKRKSDLLKNNIWICNTIGSGLFWPYPIIVVGALIALVKHRKGGKPWLELLRPDPMHPSVRYKVPPPLGCIFGLKPIEAMPPAMGDDKLIEFPEKGIAPPKEEEAIMELNC